MFVRKRNSSVSLAFIKLLLLREINAYLYTNHPDLTQWKCKLFIRLRLHLEFGNTINGIRQFGNT